MKHSVMLIIASLLSILLLSFHLTDDVLRQSEGANKWPLAVLIFVVWLYGTLMLPERVSGYTTYTSGAPPNQLPNPASPTKTAARCVPSLCSTQTF